MRIVLIVQARMGSTRLPGKSMADLAGHPLLWHVLQRVRRARSLDAIVLATTSKPEDDVLAGVADACGVSTFRGSPHDLLDRYYQAAKAFEADVVLRLPADNPVAEPEEFDRIVDFHLTGQSEFSSNLAQVFENGYPDGIGAEVFNFRDLEEVWAANSDPRQREHVHLNFFDYASQTPAQPSRFRVGTVQCPEAFRRPDLVLDVNTPEQYAFMAQLYAHLYPRNPNFHITEIIDWYDHAYRESAGH